MTAPHQERWRPSRAGLVNLWRYWDETFVFHGGRLLLRGPNGCGKSMALELLLPFLLDAEASPARLSSAAKSRGGLYERVVTGAPDGNRTGFAWVEFRRGPEVFTVGARIRASTATRKVDVSFFTTTLAVGEGLHLLDGRRETLSRRDLATAIGATGGVWDSGEQHRAAVREALFPGFGPDRYASVITALLALRKEKLSQHLDLDKLSGVLSEALPSIPEHDLAAVAEGFERLDRRRAELTALEAELGEVRHLASRQRGYARAVIAAVAADVRSAETRRDDVTRLEREADEALRTARADAEACRADLAGIAERLAALDAQIDALKESDAFQDGAGLEHLRAEARRLQAVVARDRASAESAVAECERADAALQRAADDAGVAAGNLELALDDLRRAAVSVAAEAVAAEAIRVAPDEGESVVRAWARARRNLIDEVRHAIGAHHDAMGRRDHTSEQVESDNAAVDRRLDDRRAAVVACETAVAAYEAAVRSWASSCAALGVDRLAAVLPDPPDHPPAVQSALDGLVAAYGAEFAVARRDVDTLRADCVEERGVLVSERQALGGGQIVEPPPPAWRSPRVDRAGAPLWRLVDVRAGLPAAEVDGLEAALLAAGLLDAWIAPDGTIDLPADRADVLLAGRRPSAAGQSLAGWLVPVDGAGVDPAVVTGILDALPVADTVGGAGEAGSEPVMIGLDGTFRLGPAAGRGGRRPAELLGATARERRRLARIAELNGAIEACD
ncbi:MAG: TIGR02680 family protein, partial [Acidimicrobiia bacterium]